MKQVIINLTQHAFNQDQLTDLASRNIEIINLSDEQRQ